MGGPVLEIDLTKIKRNLECYREKLGQTRICAVVKGNGYGFGLLEVAKYLEADIDYLAVARLNEAVSLRKAGLEKPILVLGCISAADFEPVLEYQLTATVKSLDVVKALSTAARRRGKMAKIHVQIETGLNRLGIAVENSFYFIKKILEIPNIELEGLYSHLGTAPDQDFSNTQLDHFRQVVNELEEAHLAIPLKHLAASYAALNYPDFQFDMVRVGGGLYGFPAISRNLHFAAAFKSFVSNLNLIKEGEYVGYNFGFRADKEMLVATIDAGYGDGFRRTPNNFGGVLINGQRCPILGYVAMDQSMVDVTHLPQTRVGEEVVLIGRQKNEEITIADAAQKLETNQYEVFTSISSRVERVYKD